MSTGFDPLYDWLGIPPDEQPPHCYRLLGVSVFEENLETIQSAADRQAAYLQTFQTAATAEIAQQLLDQIATARAWLLNPDNKAQYDAWLRQQLGPPPASAPPVAGVATEVQEAIPDLSDALGDSDPYWQSSRRVKKGRKRRSLGVMISLAAAVLAIGAIGLVALKLQDSFSEVGALEVQWPEEERRDGVLEVDGNRVDVASSQELVFRLPMGKHELRFVRPGYEPYEVTMGVTTGMTTTVRPIWREAGAKPEGGKTEDAKTELSGEQGSSAAKETVRQGE
jgi:hypothetical protein